MLKSEAELTSLPLYVTSNVLDSNPEHLYTAVGLDNTFLWLFISGRVVVPDFFIYLGSKHVKLFTFIIILFILYYFAFPTMEVSVCLILIGLLSYTRPYFIPTELQYKYIVWYQFRTVVLKLCHESELKAQNL